MNGQAIAAEAVGSAGPAPAPGAPDAGAVRPDHVARAGLERAAIGVAADGPTVRATRP